LIAGTSEKRIRDSNPLLIGVLLSIGCTSSPPTKHGWRTPVAYDGAGYPDLTLVRAPRLLFAELKSSTGTLTATRADWLDRLRLLPNVEVYIWRPSD
jgi:hypothetical protein